MASHTSFPGTSVHSRRFVIPDASTTVWSTVDQLPGASTSQRYVSQNTTWSGQINIATGTLRELQDNTRSEAQLWGAGGEEAREGHGERNTQGERAREGWRGGGEIDTQAGRGRWRGRGERDTQLGWEREREGRDMGRETLRVRGRETLRLGEGERGAGHGERDTQGERARDTQAGRGREGWRGRGERHSGWERERERGGTWGETHSGWEGERHSGWERERDGERGERHSGRERERGGREGRDMGRETLRVGEGTNKKGGPGGGPTLGPMLTSLYRAPPPNLETHPTPGSAHANLPWGISLMDLFSSVR